MVIVCEVENLAYGACQILGGLEACPPGNFEKLSSLRLNLRAFLMVYCVSTTPRQHIAQ